MKWSKKYEKCIVCGTTGKKHKGNGMCVDCWIKKWRKEHPNYNKESVKKWRQKYPERVRECARRWRKANPEKCKEISRRRDPEKKKEYSRKYQQKNKDKIREVHKQWRTKNRDRVREWNRVYKRKLRHTNPVFKLRTNVSRLVNARLKEFVYSKKFNSTWSFLPYSPEQLKIHLESLFKPGMSWTNYGIFGWHIDHIRPDCKFDYKSVEDEEFQKCWALENLQPLWAEDNLRKNKF